MKSLIKQRIDQHLQLIHLLRQNTEWHDTLEAVAADMIRVFERRGRVLFCGNGGSAADAAHLAAEFSGRFYINRPPLDADALHVNDAFLTAVSNDFNYDTAFSRALEAKARSGDMLVAISTSGSSASVINAVTKANVLGLVTVCFTGSRGHDLAEMCTHNIVIPSADTPRIQEAYMLLGHILCEWVEGKMFPHETP